MTTRAIFFGVVFILASTVGAQAQEKDKPYRWQDEAKAKKLTAQQIDHLERDRFVITGNEYKQIFTPYIGSQVPVFITTDSLLNAFHVVFEESISRLEQAQARKLPGLLEELAKHLEPTRKAAKGDAKLLDAAYRRAAIVLGVARRLLDDKALPEDAALRKLIEEEAARVIAAKETMKPAWLGPPDNSFVAIDYSRFQPRGFYTSSPALERYFRAVSWLQAIPFRLEPEEELAAFVFIGTALGERDAKRRTGMSAFCEAYSELLGSGDDWEITAAPTFGGEFNVGELKNLRETLRKSAKEESYRLVNDQLRFPPATPGAKPEISFRVFSAFALPDAVLLQRTMNPELGPRDFPGGLEVCAALGSPYAKAKLGKEMPKVLSEISRQKSLFPEPYPHLRGSIYAEYLRCQSTLLDRTEHDAPAFMHKEAWQIKNCQTALGGWAQLRHTFALHAKQSITYLSSSPDEAGFLEPAPEFFEKLMKLCERTGQVLKRAAAFDFKVSAEERMAEVAVATKILKKARDATKGIEGLSTNEITILARYNLQFNNWDAQKQSADEVKSALEHVELILSIVESGKRVPSLLGGPVERNLEYSWQHLAEMCRQLERMSHKQLRQIPWNDDEDRFIRKYGNGIADLMGYSQHASWHPRDDAPRVIDVFTNAKLGQHLHVGIGRPRDLWVVYPFKGKDVLCRGAVMPYHEFPHRARLTDDAWRTLLKTPEAPRQPAWLQSIVVDDAK